MFVLGRIFSRPFSSTTGQFTASACCFIRWNHTRSVLSRSQSGVTEYQGSFINSRSDSIAFHQWSMESKEPRGSLLISHGFGSHGARWRDRGQYWAEQGFAVSSHDHVGHGLSSGERGQVMDFNHYVADLSQQAHYMKQQYPGLPVFGLGQSMGALLVLKLAMDEPDLLRGIVISAPPIVINRKRHSPSKVFAVRLLHRFYPSFGFMKFDDDFKSKDKDASRAYTDDELCYRGKMKAGWTYAAHICMSEVIDTMESLKTPFLSLHGTRDKLAPVRGSEELLRRSQTHDGEIKVYEGGSHALFMEDQFAQRVLNDCTEWMKNRLHE